MDGPNLRGGERNRICGLAALVSKALALEKIYSTIYFLTWERNKMKIYVTKTA